MSLTYFQNSKQRHENPEIKQTRNLKMSTVEQSALQHRLFTRDLRAHAGKPGRQEDRTSLGASGARLAPVLNYSYMGRIHGSCWIIADHSGSNPLIKNLVGFFCTFSLLNYILPRCYVIFVTPMNTASTFPSPVRFAPSNNAKKIWLLPGSPVSGLHPVPIS